jgi:isoleucyl-tRNA synthetase
VCRLGRQLRTDNDLKVRQPLSKLHVVIADGTFDGESSWRDGLIGDELNIKEIDYASDEKALADVSYKANFKVLGPKFGPKMKAVAAEIEKAVSFPMVIEGVEITIDDVVVRRSPKEGMIVANEGAIVVGLETALTPELISEGIAREFVSQVQNLRKDAGYSVSDRVNVVVEADGEVMAALEEHRAYVTSELMADSLVAGTVDSEANDLNGHQVKISVSRIG